MGADHVNTHTLPVAQGTPYLWHEERRRGRREEDLKQRRSLGRARAPVRKLVLEAELGDA